MSIISTITNLDWRFGGAALPKFGTRQFAWPAANARPSPSPLLPKPGESEWHRERKAMPVFMINARLYNRLVRRAITHSDPLIPIQKDIAVGGA